ncbi:MAG TPA: hypothetical protein PLJ34_08785, partial [Hyphomicrobiales bacterium]|nr:hypothetical protein [Hyphomicrobiales bacterium]
MAEHATDLTGIAVIMTLAVLLGLLFMHLRQPAIVGYILTGIVLGWTGAVDGAGGWIGGIATAFLAAALWTFFIAPKATRRLDTAP